MKEDIIDITIFMNERTELLLPETLGQLSHFGFIMLCGASEDGKKIRFQAKFKKSTLDEVILQMMIADKFNIVQVVMDTGENPPENYLFSQDYEGWQANSKIDGDKLIISLRQGQSYCRRKTSASMKHDVCDKLTDIAQIIDDVLKNYTQKH